MSTQFFQRQATARTNTVWLVFLFFLAVVGIIGAAAVAGYAIAEIVRQQNADQKQAIDPMVFAAVFGAVAGVVIVLGSLYQVIALRAGGGSSVAESVGGRPLISDTASLEEKRVLNVVEEMAIASGTPVPPVYILDEPGVNAFAAGYRPSDAVIGVTRGAIQNLTREQLQGVIAHEFSHVLNGDMRMNIRMIGILHGVLLLSLIGRFLFQSLRFVGGGSNSDSNKGRGGIVILMVLLGVALILIGSIGSFIGGLIKAAVCRQREYLADASAVQFTRNPNGIGGALKRIASISQHGRLKHPNAAVASHLYFSQGVYEGLSGLLATHPPLPKRILAIDPTWNGKFDSIDPVLVATVASGAIGSTTQKGFAGPSIGFADGQMDATHNLPVDVVRDSVEQVGLPEDIHRQYSAHLLSQLDDKLKAAAADPFSARALVFALLLDRDSAVAELQIEQLRNSIAKEVVELTLRLAPLAAAAPEAVRLPLIDLSLPMLRRMSAPQYERFARAFEKLITADNKISIFEWTLAQVLSRNLKSQFTRTSNVTTLYSSLSKVEHEVSVLLSTLARVGHSGIEVEHAFRAATSKIPGVTLKLVGVSECSFDHLEASLKKLRRASEQRRGEIIDACAACVTADGVVKVREGELLRGIADLLECPMPPLIGSRRDR